MYFLIYNCLYLDIPHSTAYTYIDTFLMAYSYNANTGVQGWNILGRNPFPQRPILAADQINAAVWGECGREDSRGADKELIMDGDSNRRKVFFGWYEGMVSRIIHSDESHMVGDYGMSVTCNHNATM